MGIKIKHLCLIGFHLLNVLLPAGDLDLLIDLDQLNDNDIFMVVI